MSPTEPPISVYGTNGTKALRLENTGIYGRLENAGIYGTVRSERSTVYGTLPRNYLNNRISQFSTPAFMYATLSKQQLGARRSLKEAGLQEEDGGSERSSSSEGEPVGTAAAAEGCKIKRGVTFHTLHSSSTVHQLHGDAYIYNYLKKKPGLTHHTLL